MSKTTLPETLDTILKALDVIAAMALDPSRRDRVVAHEMKLGQIKSRVELILAWIDIERPRPTKLGEIKWTK
jgi:hypothetical protein